MGYAQISQKGQGLHLRQYSRAFIVEDNSKRVVFVNVDAAMIGDAVKRHVVDKLQEDYGVLYTLDNVVISGTHTHSTPGGAMMYLLYDLSTFGFVKESFDALIEGIYQSIVNADDNLQDGRLYIGLTKVLNATLNRSPSSYMANPAEERLKYEYDTDKILTQIRFVNANDIVIGAINWFAIHGTSMNNTNTLVSGDNIGYASIQLEQKMNPNDLPGKGAFVGAFASSNLGDVSPNTNGPRCYPSGDACDVEKSSCTAPGDQCYSLGPGVDMFESVKIIATRLSGAAWDLIQYKNGTEITGNINYIHQFVDMPSYKTTYHNPETNQRENVTGCLPAMGFSFASGTTDGPGIFPFTQGTTLTDNLLWNIVRDYLPSITPLDDVKCHSPKPILLDTGRAILPYQWQPEIVATQIVKIGNVMLIAVPGEFTTMSGRRLRESVRNATLQAGGGDVEVVVAGLSNTYSSYVTTFEEYQVQRYEAASTIFGPHTLTIYLKQYQDLVKAMLNNQSIWAGPTPPVLDNMLISLQAGVPADTTPLGKNFGDVTQQPNGTYKTGDQVNVKFLAGNPRNDLRHGDTYFEVERLTSNGVWITVAVDSNFETKFMWTAASLSAPSTVLIMWGIPSTANVGTYRIRHFGAAKGLLGGITQYEGISNSFAVST